MPEKKTKVKLGQKNLAMLPSYFDYIVVHQRQKERFRPELSPKFLLTSGPNPTRKARPDLQLCLTQLHTLQERTITFYYIVFYSNYCNYILPWPGDS